MNKHMYILVSGGRTAASSPFEFVRLLCGGNWFDSECTDEEYVVNFSGRYRELHGVTARTGTPGHFMGDLKKYGYIKGWEARPFIIVIPIGLEACRRGSFFFHCSGYPSYPAFQKGAGSTTSLFGKPFFFSPPFSP